MRKRIVVLISASMSLVLLAPHAHAADVFGDNGANTLNGTAGGDFMFGKRGKDVISGGGGADVLSGSSGADRLQGQGGIGDGFFDDDGKSTSTERRDVLVGGDDNAVLISADGEKDSLDCGAATEDGLAIADLNDSVVNCDSVTNVSGELTPGGARFIPGSGANNSLAPLAPAERSAMFGKNGNDTLTGSSDNDLLAGGKGRDLLDALAGADALIDDDGKSGDTLRGGDGADMFFAADGAADTIDCGVNDNDADLVYADTTLDTVLNCDGTDPDTVNLG
jgi:Ca2+-binding RTX toxin-like protein